MKIVGNYTQVTRQGHGVIEDLTKAYVVQYNETDIWGDVTTKIEIHRDSLAAETKVLELENVSGIHTYSNVKIDDIRVGLLRDAIASENLV